MIKKIFVSFFCFLYVINLSHAQPPSIEWQKCYGGIGSEYSTDIQQTADGGYIACGYTNSNSGDITINHGGIDYWVIKLDALGTLIWQKSFGGSGDDWGQSIQQTIDGGYIVAGYSNSTDGQVTGNHGDNDYWLVKLNNVGDIVWQRSYGGTLKDEAYNIKQTSDGGFIIAGTSKSIDGDITGNHGDNDYWILKLDIAGNLIWQKSYGGSSRDAANSISQTSDGGFIITGTSGSIDGDVINGSGGAIAWILKLNNTGVIEWQKTYGSRIPGDVSHSIIQTNDGGYVVAGDCAGNGGDVTGFHGNIDYWIIKLDVAGTLLWQKTLGGSTGDQSNCVRQTSDGGYLVVGRSSSMNGDVTGNHGNWEIWLTKLTATGNLQWQKAMGGILKEYGYGVWQTTDGGFIVSGVTTSDNNGDVGPKHGGDDFWIVKLGPETVPITLTNFTATLNGKDVLCKWKTQQEQNSSYFIIERSYDAIHLVSRGKLSAAGNSSLPLEYNFTDQDVLSTGKNFLYYRLKMVDIDGSFKYSNTIKVKLNYSPDISVSPDPVVDVLNISFLSSMNDKAILSIIDQTGKRVFQKNVNIHQGKNSFPLTVSFLPVGNYILSVKGKKNYLSRFVKLGR